MLLVGAPSGAALERGCDMAGGFFDVALAQDNTAATRAAQAENSARWAVSQHIVETRGRMAIRRSDPIIFEAPFFEPPYVSTGLTIKKDFAPESGWIPQASAGVWQWHRNPKGHYTGAFIFIAVHGAQASSELQHHFLFSGVAYKDLGSTVAADAQLLSVRPVGFGGM